MHMLKITSSDGTSVLIPEKNVLQVSVATPVTTTQPFVTGRITAVKYLDGTNAAAPVTTVVTVAAYNGSNTKYEYGCLLESGQFNPYLKN